MSTKEVNSILQKSLISYILIMNPEVDANELDKLDLYSLVDMYCQTYLIPVECFQNCLANMVREYKTANLDEQLSDEEIYITTNAFEPTNHIGQASAYYEEMKLELANKISEANDKFFECLQDVNIENERLQNVRTSLEKSEIRSELAQANIALNKARSIESNLITQEKNLHEAYTMFQKRRDLYFSKLNSLRDDYEEKYSLARAKQN